MSGAAPPGWPSAVPPPTSDGFPDGTVAFLLDQCPADYRGYAVLRRHPAVLAYLAGAHLAAAQDASRQALAGMRAALRDQVPPDALGDALGAVQAELVRLESAARAVRLVAEALAGGRFRPRL